jgi:hypothetical protein
LRADEYYGAALLDERLTREAGLFVLSRRRQRAGAAARAGQPLPALEDALAQQNEREHDEHEKTAEQRKHDI